MEEDQQVQEEDAGPVVWGVVEVVEEAWEEELASEEVRELVEDRPALSVLAVVL